MTKILLEILAFILISAGADVGRSKESRLKFFSWKWFLQITLFVIAANIFEFIGKHYVK